MELGTYAGLLVVAGVLRLWDLGSRAMHHDESLHAFYSWNLYKGDGYQHNPMMHGPLQFEANAAVFFLFGDSDYTARLPYALVGTALVGLPFFFRHRLGRLGALLVSGMLTFSPAMLYFSRFARNDILVAAWSLGLVICMWRYIDEGRNRYVYGAAVLLALLFATKETGYLVTAVLSTFLLFLVAPPAWAKLRADLDTRDVSPPIALLRVGRAIVGTIARGVDVSRVSRSTGFLVMMVTVTLPLWSAFVSVFQGTAVFGWSNLVLASGGGSAIGAPSSGGLVVAAYVVALLLAISARLGFLWSWSVWWRSALIFYAIWVLLYTTFLTNMTGIGSGVWQSLGYWVVQQGEARGNQPWYYYFVLTSVYEFLPLLFSVVAAVFYFRRRDVFGRFLVFWAIGTLVLHTVASEKMPWLLVNVTLPLIVLAGKFLADVILETHWRGLPRRDWTLVMAGTALFILLLWQLAFFEPESGSPVGLVIAIVLAVVLLGMLAYGVHLTRRIGTRNLAMAAAVPVVVIMLGLTIRAGWTASFRNGDVPVEMIVYTQTSPEIAQLAKEIERVGEATGEGSQIPLAIDQTSGFTWPWAWYLRDYTQVSYPSYTGTPLEQPPDAAVLVIHAQNQAGVDEALEQRFPNGQRIRHRWWFPEDTYRGLTLGRFLGSFIDREAWRRAMDYFLNREGVRDRLGSEDAFVYFAEDVPHTFSALP